MRRKAHLLPLPVGDKPDWRPLVDYYLDRFRDGVMPSSVQELDQWAANATAFDATGSWRARIVRGQLWVKTIRFHAHWMERASVLRMLLIALRSRPKGGRLPALPDLELVYGHADNDNTPSMQVCTRQATAPCKHVRVPLPLFTNSYNPRRGGLPVPEFTWAGWQRAPPWCQQVGELDAAAEAHPWPERDKRLYFSGGLNNGHHRKELRRLALAEMVAGRTDELHVRDVSSKFHRWGQFDRIQPDGVQMLLNRSSSSLSASPLPLHAACSYQYTINLPGFGYSSRLRSLLRCGGAVVQVVHPSVEFFVPLLRDKVHYFLIDGREPVRDQLLQLLRALRADTSIPGMLDPNAARVAAAGRQFAQRWLSFDGVIQYFRTLLQRYGELYEKGRMLSGAPSLAERDHAAEGFIRVSSDAELRTVAGLCASCKPRGRNGADPQAGCARLRAPEMLQRKQPRCTLWAPRGGGRCFDERCCIGWDCGVRPLGCA